MTMHLSDETGRLRRAIRGGIAGLVATAPMTAAMLFLHARLPRREQQPLPPSEITARIEDASGLEPPPPELHRSLTLAAHFAYGAAMGAVYAAGPRRGVALPPPLRGALFGLSVWTGSYLGWLPLARIRPPAIRDSPRRSGLMIVAHLVWGVALDLTLALLEPRTAALDRPESDRGSSER